MEYVYNNHGTSGLGTRRVSQWIEFSNKEDEAVFDRLKLPGKGGGFLLLGESGNCYRYYGKKVTWLFDRSTLGGIGKTRRGLLMAALEEDLRGAAEAIARARALSKAGRRG